MGLKTNDVIAIIAPNLPDTILGLLGSLSGGFIVTTMNPLFTAGKRIVFSNVFHISFNFMHEVSRE